MTAYSRQQSVDLATRLAQALHGLRSRIPAHRGILFGLIILVGLIAFETFNFSTTEFALADLLGNLSFAGVSWATILALAFCSIDFAGIARLMTPESSDQQPAEIWYLLGAWFLGATMNAMLTWWSVSLALVGHAGLGNEVLGRDALLGSVPLFIAALVWLIRVLLIGTLTLAGGRLFSLGQRQVVRSGSQARQAHRPAGAPAPAAAARSSANGRPLSRQEPRPAPRPMARASSRR
jgi:hypothetical protein